jgi:predicted transcriptional regulator
MEMNRKTLKIGIMSLEDYKKRTIAIAGGRNRPAVDEPKIWFESIRSVAQVLSPENQALLKIILEHEPQSLVQLERLSNRKKSNLSRTLRTLESFGIVELPVHKGRLAPKVIATDFQLEFGLNS